MTNNEHALDTPHHDLCWMFHVLINTDLCETLSRPAMEVLDLLDAALNDAVVTKYYPSSTLKLTHKPQDLDAS